MSQTTSFFKQAWFGPLPQDLQELLELSSSLLEDQTKSPKIVADYSFLVFAAAKAYEGFLKYYLWRAGLIDEATYKSKRFRIGRAINPDVSFAQRDEHWLYDDLARNCSLELAKQLWQTWLECRNQVFHYFPGKINKISLLEAQIKVKKITAAIEAAVLCQEKTRA